MNIKRKLVKVRFFKRVNTWKRKQSIQIMLSTLKMAGFTKASLEQLRVIQSTPTSTKEEKIKKALAIANIIITTHMININQYKKARIVVNRKKY